LELVNIKYLEMHVTHACNLACESCSHYSNHSHRGLLDLEEAAASVANWSKRVSVKRFRLLGGEPTIHPMLPEFVKLARRHLADATVEIVTNGFFLHRHPGLPYLLDDLGNCEITVSVHHNSPEYMQKIRPVLDLIATWRKKHKFGIIIRHSYKNWTRRYNGFGSNMLPYEDGEPQASWSICPARSCIQLFEGALWKCGPIAYLKLQNERYNLSDRWKRYLEYRPLYLDASDDELRDFIGRGAESICGMCSAKKRYFDLPNPLRNGVVAEL